MNDGPAPAGPAVERRALIRNQRGLHARAAAKFVKLATEYVADIQVSKGGQTVSGRSIMGLMMLAAGPGTEIVLSARGDDAEAALDAICAVIADKFEED
ncbi:MAG: HPr family phosphocarrier protein [Rhodobacterales bacterium]|nr:HPr family phosphocarrier protein [Rhodobacterales bacterium]